MFKKLLLATAVSCGLGFSATADAVDQNVLEGEVLAWTVASVASCDNASNLERDFRAEVARVDADFAEVVAALDILADADNVCGLMNDFSAAMLRLSTTNVAEFEARLLVEDEVIPVTEIDPPEGNGVTQKSVILDGSALPPPLSANPAPSSDYQ